MAFDYSELGGLLDGVGAFTPGTVRRVGGYDGGAFRSDDGEHPFVAEVPTAFSIRGDMPGRGGHYGNLYVHVDALRRAGVADGDLRVAVHMLLADVARSERKANAGWAIDPDLKDGLSFIERIDGEPAEANGVEAIRVYLSESEDTGEWCEWARDVRRVVVALAARGVDSHAVMYAVPDESAGYDGYSEWAPDIHNYADFWRFEVDADGRSRVVLGRDGGEPGVYEDGALIDEV